MQIRNYYKWKLFGKAMTKEDLSGKVEITRTGKLRKGVVKEAFISYGNNDIRDEDIAEAALKAGYNFNEQLTYRIVIEPKD